MDPTTPTAPMVAIQLRQLDVPPGKSLLRCNEALVRGRPTFDLNQDPPPDLALEIDLPSQSLNRFPVYARPGVPEIWCYDGGALAIYLLRGDRYSQVEQSWIFPTRDIRSLPQLIEAHCSLGWLALCRAVRTWVKESA